jgi:hypothetical protein
MCPRKIPIDMDRFGTSLRAAARLRAEGWSASGRSSAVAPKEIGRPEK